MAQVRSKIGFLVTLDLRLPCSHRNVENFKSQGTPIDSRGSGLRFYLVVSFFQHVLFFNVSVKLVDQSSSKMDMQQGGKRILGNRVFYFGPVR